MNSLTIKSINILRSEFLNGLSSDSFVERLGLKLFALTQPIVAGYESTKFSHYFCSSTLDIVCSGMWFDPKKLTRTVFEMTGVSCTYSNAMQCATWGFLVQQHLANKPDVGNIILSIVDANPLGMRFWEENFAWGKTGHKITQIHLEIPKFSTEKTEIGVKPESFISTGKCNPSVMLYDYASEIQKAMFERTGHTLAVSFFEEKMRKGLRRTLEGYLYLPDLYEEYGHLCGADPWVSVAKDGGRPEVSTKKYLLSSIAAEGYFCFLSAKTTEQSCIHIEE